MGEPGRSKSKRSGDLAFKARQLKKLREILLKLKQPTFGQLVGYSKDSISKYENGTYDISDGVIKKIVDALSSEFLYINVKKLNLDKNIINTIKTIDLETFFKRSYSIHGQQIIPITDYSFEESLLNWPDENFRPVARKEHLDLIQSTFSGELKNLERFSFKSLSALTNRYIVPYEQLDIFMPENGLMLVYSSITKISDKTPSKENTQTELVEENRSFSYPQIILEISEKPPEEPLDTYWDKEFDNLKKQLDEHIDDIMRWNTESPLCVFSIAPQPLVVKLGQLLSNVSNIEIHQPSKINKSGITWDWEQTDRGANYLFSYPKNINDTIALNLSLDSTIDDKDIESILGNKISIWKLTIKESADEFLKSKNQLIIFRKSFRDIFTMILNKHDHCSQLHIFLSVPLAIAFEIGRIWDPDNDPELILYGLSSESGDYYPIQTISKD